MGTNRPQTTRIDGSHQRRPRRMGLVAGWGRYPLIVAEALKAQDYEVYCLGVTGEADPRLSEICDDFRFLGLARISTAIRYFKRHGITEATMVGKVHKAALFRPWRWLAYLPDLRTIRMLLPHLFSRRKDCRDDTLLGVIVAEFASEGIHFVPATDYVPELLARQGRLTRRGPSPWQQKDIDFGWEIAKQLGRLDIGQSVAVKDQAVLALEAIEGTDECIRRAGKLCKSGGFTVVKTAKPQQDMRFDVPAIGRRTLQTMIEAGAKVLAIEAGRTIILDEPDLIDFANRNRLIVVALDNQPHPPPQPAAGETGAFHPHQETIPETPSRTRER